MRYWYLPGENNNISSMVTIWWDSINCVSPAADMPATLRHSCRRSGDVGVMADVTAASIVRFDLGQFY